MKKFLLMLGLASLLNLEAKSLEKEYMEMSSSKKELLQSLYNYGLQYGLEYTIPAIAWKESHVGTYLLNVNDKLSYDCGLMMTNTKSVLKREGRKYNKYNATKVCQKLMTNVNYSLITAIEELTYWQTMYPNNWMKIWTSYNKGFNNKDSYQDAYAIDIRNKIKVLKKYLKREN